MKKSVYLFGVALTLITSISTASGAEMNFGTIQRDNSFYGDLFGENITDVSDAWMQRESESKIYFDVYTNEGEIELISDTYNTVNDFNTAIAGNYTMEISTPGNTSGYSFTINDVATGWFSNVPVLNSVPGSIPQEYDFSWSWDDNADVKYTEYGIDEADFWQGEETPSDSTGFADKSLSADFQDNTGEGEFLILYGNILSEQFITEWTLESGNDLFNGENPFEFAASEDFAKFTVIPEPGTFLAMLMFGFFAIFRHRNRRN